MYERVKRAVPWVLRMTVATVALTPVSVHAQDVPWTESIHTLVANVTDVIAPAIGVCGFIAVGASAIMGETGKVFKIGIAVVVGATLMAKAQDIWTSFFGGTGGT
jgi:type IV secretory pathway VirB2 component (pilin)